MYLIGALGLQNFVIRNVHAKLNVKNGFHMVVAIASVLGLAGVNAYYFGVWVGILNPLTLIGVTVIALCGLLRIRTAPDPAQKNRIP